MVQTSNTARKSRFYAYGLVIVLMLVSAFVGATASRAWSPTFFPAPAAAPPLAEVEPVQSARTFSPAAVDELVQEQRDLREANRQEQALRGARAAEPVTSSELAPAIVGDVNSDAKQLEQEIRDLKQFERSLHGGATTGPADTTPPAVTSGYERYRIFKEEQIQSAQ